MPAKKKKKLLLQSSIKLPKTKQWGLLQAGINFPKHRNQVLLERSDQLVYLKTSEIIQNIFVKRTPGNFKSSPDECCKRNTQP